MDTDTPVVYDDLRDEDGALNIRSITGNYIISLDGGNQCNLNQNTTLRFCTESGRSYILNVNYDGQDKKYQVTSGNSYAIHCGTLVCFRTSLIVEFYTETTTTVTTISQQGKVVIKNGTDEDIQVAFSIDSGSNQSNSYFKLTSNAHEAWGRTHGNFYQCCVFYRNITYNYIVQAGRSYIFYSTTKLFDLDNNTPVTYDDISDEDGNITLRSVNGNYTVSLNNGYEGQVGLNRNTTYRFSRSSGNYILTVAFNGQEKKYEVTSGYAYILWSGTLICYRTGILVQVHTQT